MEKKKSQPFNSIRFDSKSNPKERKKAKESTQRIRTKPRCTTMNKQNIVLIRIKKIEEFIEIEE